MKLNSQKLFPEFWKFPEAQNICIFWSSGERGLQTKSGRIMWLGLVCPGTRFFIQRQKSDRLDRKIIRQRTQHDLILTVGELVSFD